MKKDGIYKLYQATVKNKDVAVMDFITNTLAKTQSMFVYEGLPDTLPQKEFERLLQTTGNAFVTKVNGELYALSGTKGGVLDAYYRPTVYTVANPYLGVNKVYKINVDGVLIENDSQGASLLPIIGKYAVLYTDGVISLNTASVLTRITMLISASDDKTKQSAEQFLQRIENGEFSIIGENAFFKGVNMQTAPTTNSVYITQLIEMIQYYKASLLNELGLNANYNMKRERLNLGEVSMNIDALLPYVDDMKRERENGVQRINEMFGTNITVQLNSSWHLNKDNYLTELENVERHDNPELEPTTPENNGDGTTSHETEETTPNGTETGENDNETEETQETEETESEKDETEKDEDNES